MKWMTKAVSIPVKLLKNKIFFLIFLNGFLLAMLGYFYTEDNYESQLFKALSQQVYQTSKGTSTDSLLTASLGLTHDLEQYRLTVFGNKEISALKSELIRPVTFDLMTGSGACGSYSYVLSRLLNEMNIETRFAQMKVNGEFGGHIVIEAKTITGWVAMDPSYNLIFKKPNGHFASFQEVKDNWASYSQQLPAGYNKDYSYSDVQYTNWSKVPVLMPMLKGVLNVTMGEKAANEFSIRNLFLRKFNFLFKLALVIYVIITAFFISLYMKQSSEIENFRQALLFPKLGKKMAATPIAAA